MPIKEQNLQPIKNLDSRQEAVHNSVSVTDYWIKKIPEGEEDNPGLSQIFGVLRRRISLIAAVAAVTTVAASALSFTRTPNYEGKFQILVEPLKSSESQLLVLLSETLKQNASDLTRQAGTALDYQALMEVLKSPHLMNPAIDKIRTRYPEVSYGTLIGYEGINQGSELLQITRISKGKNESRVISVSYTDPNPEKVKFILEQISQAYLKYSLEQQQTNLRQGIKFVDEQVPKLEMRVLGLQAQLQRFQQSHNIVDPQLQGQQLVTRADQLQAQGLNIQKELAQMRSSYASLQSQVGMTQQQAIAASALSESQQYQQILSKLSDLDAKIAQESVRFRDENPALQALREERQKLLPLLEKEARLALGTVVSGTTINPQARGYQNSVRRDLTQQLANTGNQIKSLEASQKANEQALKIINEQIKQYPQITRQYANLHRELQVATDTLNQLLAKKEALRVSDAQEQVPWELIMPPTIPQDKGGALIPLPASKSRDIGMGAVGGLLLGIAIAFSIENFKNVFYNTKEVKASTKLPLLGAIPFSQEVKKLAGGSDVVNLSAKSVVVVSEPQRKSSNTCNFLEAFSSLYAKVEFLKSNTTIKSISVTSATDGDGKSTVAAYLAQAAAEAGQRVLLVDADLYHPQIHQRLGLSNEKGLSELLTEELDFSQLIVRSPSENNLHVLRAGKQPANAVKLLSSQKMHTLVDKFTTQFDLIIYDTPHLLGSMSGNIVANYTDGVVLVVALGKTERPNLRQALEESKAAHLSILGLVTNGLNA